MADIDTVVTLKDKYVAYLEKTFGKPIKEILEEYGSAEAESIIDAAHDKLKADLTIDDKIAELEK